VVMFGRISDPRSQISNMMVLGVQCGTEI
jgi:hypothetical protein